MLRYVLTFEQVFVNLILKQWFGGSDEFKATQIESKDLIEAVGEGRAGAEWVESRDSMLAKIILCDQFSRLAFKGTAKAFQFDHVALATSLKIINSDSFTTDYVAAERMFIAMPLEHSESVECHDKLPTIVPLINADAHEDIKGIMDIAGNNKDHGEVIRRFGRYPSRNHALGRTNTPEEEEYLASPDLPGWAKSQLSS